MITVAFTIGLTVLDLKKHFSFEMRVPSDIIQITLEGKTQKMPESVGDISENKVTYLLYYDAKGTFLFISNKFTYHFYLEKNVDDDQTLMDIGVQPHGMIQFEMSSLDPENYPMRPVKPQQEYNMPDVITVRVQTGTVKLLTD